MFVKSSCDLKHDKNGFLRPCPKQFSFFDNRKSWYLWSSITKISTSILICCLLKATAQIFTNALSGFSFRPRLWLSTMEQIRKWFGQRLRRSTGLKENHRWMNRNVCSPPATTVSVRNPATIRTEPTHLGVVCVCVGVYHWVPCVSLKGLILDYTEQPNQMHALFPCSWSKQGSLVTDWLELCVGSAQAYMFVSYLQRTVYKHHSSTHTQNATSDKKVYWFTNKD